jgi:NADH-quinone oxidoreductase subunit C
MGHPAPVFAPNTGVIVAAKKIVPAKGLIDAVEAVGEVTLTVKCEALIATMTALKESLAYQQLMEIAGVDYPDRPERFEVVYHLLSVTKNHRIRVKVLTDELTPVPSVTGLWPVAGWLEREVFDMYGVLFDGNTDLRRILTDYGFQGHPFRKDFPLTGFTEMRWSEEEKRVIYEPVRLAQDFRSFDFLSPWEGADYVLPGDEKAKSPAPAAPPAPLQADVDKKADAAPKLRVRKVASKAEIKS